MRHSLRKRLIDFSWQEESEKLFLNFSVAVETSYANSLPIKSFFDWYIISIEYTLERCLFPKGPSPFLPVPRRLRRLHKPIHCFALSFITTKESLQFNWTPRSLFVRTWIRKKNGLFLLSTQDTIIQKFSNGSHKFLFLQKPSLH